MADNTTTTTVTTTPNPNLTPDPTIQRIGKDVPLTADLVAAIIAAYKHGGISEAAGQLPGAVEVVKEDIAAVEAAIPVVKAGYKTTEFWLATGSVLAVAFIPVITHQPVSPIVASVIGAIATVYAVVRGIVKKQ